MFTRTLDGAGRSLENIENCLMRPSELRTGCTIERNQASLPFAAHQAHGAGKVFAAGQRVLERSWNSSWRAWARRQVFDRAPDNLAQQE